MGIDTQRLRALQVVHGTAACCKLYDAGCSWYAARCILHTYCSFDRSGPFTVQPCARHRVKSRMDHAARRHELRTPVQCVECVSSCSGLFACAYGTASAAQRSCMEQRSAAQHMQVQSVPNRVLTCSSCCSRPQFTQIESSYSAERDSGGGKCEMKTTCPFLSRSGSRTTCASTDSPSRYRENP